MFTTRFRERHAARVTKGRDDINRFDGFLCHQRLKFVDLHAVAVGADGLKIRLRQAENLQRGKIGWTLDDDGIAWVN